jgi:hypothetical protein
MQLAHPLIWEARIFTSSLRFGSRLEEMARDMVYHSFIIEGAAVAGFSLAVMVGILLVVPTS